MDDLTSLLSQYGFVPVLTVAIIVAGKVIVSVVTTWGVDDDKKADILEAVGEMFKLGRRKK